MREFIIDFCLRQASDPLMVQGAGGNISWKDGKNLWIKASGTCLAHARKRDIFVPVNLKHLNLEIQKGNFETVPLVLDSCPRRPSIETLLHALMPQKIVVHFHMIDVLAYLVRENCEIESIVGRNFQYSIVDYYRPGMELAQAVFLEIEKNSSATIIFMRNHGIIVGDKNIETVNKTLDTLRSLFHQCPVPDVKLTIPQKSVISASGIEYQPFEDKKIHQLVFNRILFDRLYTDWAIYPDHVVFLGDHPQICKKVEEIDDNDLAEILFIKNKGGFIRGIPHPIKVAQLRCYYEVLARQHSDERLKSLSPKDVTDLLNWEAEKYRMTDAEEK